MPLARFLVKVEAGCTPTVEVNGRCLPDGIVVSGMGLQLNGAGISVLTLAVDGEGTIEGEGVVVVRQESDEVEYLRRFLLNLDWEEVDRLALDASPGLDSKPGEGYKAALLALVRT